MAGFDRESTVEALREAGRPLAAAALARRLGIGSGQLGSFRRFLRKLVKEGELYRVKGARYAPPERINLVVGRLQVTRSGAAFLLSEGKGPDVRVRAEHLVAAYDGDKVAVRVERMRRGRPEGSVVRVLERGRSQLVGTVRRRRGFVVVEPADARFRREVLVRESETAGASDGTRVVVEIVDWGSARSGPVGRVSEVLGRPGDPGVDVLTIIVAHGLPTEFPAEVLAEADALSPGIPRRELQRRIDLRDRTIVTIDPQTARDFDDALSLERREDGTLDLGVHIADVSHYVRHGSAIDREARQRGTSVYLVDRVLPMLPEVLSNELCSLKPGVDRLAMSVLMHVTPRGKVLAARVEDTVIRSTRRLAYEEVQEYLDGVPAARRELEDVGELLEGLHRLARVLTRRRMRRGALDFDFPDSRVELDAEGLPLDVHEVVRLDSHRLVEELMLLANEAVARRLERADAPALYRVHEKPSPAKLDELRSFVARFGHDLGSQGGDAAPRALAGLLAKFEGRPEEPVVQMLVLRSLARARYDPKPLGHYALALRDYAHFTSPIRRYPDLVVHRALRVLAGRQKPAFRNRDRASVWLSETAERASERERTAERAERDSVELKKVQLMEQHLGEVFAGAVVGVESFGLFVELERYHVRGLVHASALDDDFYELREAEFALVGRQRRRRFALGDRVEVLVAAANRELRQIDFALAGEHGSRSKPPKRGAAGPRKSAGRKKSTGKKKKPNASARKRRRR